MDNFKTSNTLKDIGNLIKLRPEIDLDGRTTKHIRSHLSVTDLLPCDYNLDLSKINKNGWAISYDFSSATEDYKNLCAAYNLSTPALGLRLWLTDDSVANDNFSNDYSPNVIETGLSSLEGMSNIIRSIKSATSLGKSVGSNGQNVITATSDFTKGVAQDTFNGAMNFIGDGAVKQAVQDAGNAVIGTAAEMIFQGKKISLPKIWTSSSYNPSLTLAVKLVSPYGDPESVKYYITEQLIYLLLLGSPTTNDGMSYGLPRPLRIHGYGTSNINLGYIEGINVRRGGRETAYNIYKQPLILDINITIRPLAAGFAACVPKFKDIATMDDATKPFSEDYITESPTITTIGNIIQSLRPAPISVVMANDVSEKLVLGTTHSSLLIENVTRGLSNLSGETK